MKRDKRIYLDYAATTAVDPAVLDAMLPFFSEKFGNPASLHKFGQEAKDALEKGRRSIADLLGVRKEEIVFTASATESNNLAIKGIMEANKDKGKHIIVSSIEHDCVYESAKWLGTQGFRVDYLKVDKFGVINLGDLEKLITDKTVLVSVIHANNEIGTIQPISKIGAICRANKIYFHVDASQSLGKIPLSIKESHIDLLTGSSHKIYGPKGVAMLYVRKGINISPVIHGGGQEFGIRSSTVNVAGIVGFTKALEIAFKNMDKESERLTKLRNKFIKGILNNIPETFLNGHPRKRLPNNVNIRFSHIEGEAILMRLDDEGIAVSTGSACSSPKLEPSHVLLATGLSHEQAHGAIRFSLGRWTTEKEIDCVLSVLPRIVRSLRSISPLK